MSGFTNFIPMAASAAGSLIQSASKESAQSDAIETQNEAIERHNQLIAAQQAQQEQEQMNLLEQRQATARANMASSGAGGTGGGSGDALLAGMASRTETSIANNNQATQYRYSPYISDDSSSNLLDSTLSNGLNVFQSFYGGMD